MRDDRSILVIDDDPMLCRTISDILAHHGHETKVSTDGSGGITAAETDSARFAVAIIDLRLPDMNGLDVVSRIREISPLTQIVVLTGNASLESAIEAMRGDSFEYLVKPVAPNVLLDTVEKGIDRWKHQRAEEALRRDQERFQLLVEALSDVVTVVLPDGTIQYQSPSALRVLGYAPGFLVERPFLELVHRSERDIVQRRLDEALRGGDEMGEVEFHFRNAEGDWTLMEGVARPLHGGENPPAVVTARDITERRRLERELSQAQKMESIGRLAGGVAHDFNNQLTAILGGLELAAMYEEVPERVLDELSEVKSAAERAARLTRQLLLFSRNKIEEKGLIDMNDLISEMASMLRRLIPERVLLDLDLEEGIPTVHADPTQLEQVLLNLVVNARDALGDEGGEIGVRTRLRKAMDGGDEVPDALRRGPVVWLSVSDNGPGMSQDTLDRIFEPFFTTKDGGEGTGLGLATTFGIVKRASGLVRAESRLGEGATFHVYFPARTMSGLDSGRTADEGESTSEVLGQGRTVLLVEDDESVMRVVKRILERVGFSVLGATSGEKATRIARERGEEPIHLLLSDLVLQETTGPAVAETIRSIRPDIPVLFMSGYAREDVLVKGRVPFGADVVPKPIEFDDLLARVQETLTRAGGRSDHEGTP